MSAIESRISGYRVWPGGGYARSQRATALWWRYIFRRRCHSIFQRLPTKWRGPTHNFQITPEGAAWTTSTMLSCCQGWLRCASWLPPAASPGAFAASGCAVAFGLSCEAARRVLARKIDRFRFFFFVYIQKFFGCRLECKTCFVREKNARLFIPPILLFYSPCFCLVFLSFGLALTRFKRAKSKSIRNSRAVESGTYRHTESHTLPTTDKNNA